VGADRGQEHAVAAQVQLRPEQQARTRAGGRVAGVALVSCLASYGFSRLTGLVAEQVTLPVGTGALLLGVALTAWAPQRFGWRWGSTGQHLGLIAGSLAGVVAVVAGFRWLTGATPYQPSVGELVIVPLGEEALFRGFLLVTLLAIFTRWLAEPAALRWAVVVSAVSFGVGHLGNLGYVPTSFVVVQALAATAFGLLAGWVRVRTQSLVGPVLLHSAMNAAAVL
jgi:membrane protease YdiL (CAAX protease family)